MKEPWCQFCRHDDGTFDYDELHAILCGFFFPLWLWPFVLRWSDGLLIGLLDGEPHYVGLGMLLRLAGLYLLLKGAF